MTENEKYIEGLEKMTAKAKFLREKVSADVETITPAVAKAMLKHNVGNRPVDKERVAMLAADIVAGNWHENGESIKFDKNGNLVDGQHRLMACILAGIPIKSIVIRGVEDARGIDCGKKRTFGDFAKMGFSTISGELTGHVYSAIAAFLLRLESPSRKTFSNDEREHTISNHSDSFAFAKHYFDMGRRGLSQRGILRASAWAAIVSAYECGYNYTLLSEFCDCLVTGETTNERILPVVRLRNKLQTIYGGGSEVQKDIYMMTQHILKAVETGNVKAKPVIGKNEYYKVR